MLTNGRNASDVNVLALKVCSLFREYEESSRASQSELCIEPLVSPSNLLKFALFFNVDLRFEPDLVRPLKSYIALFRHQYLKWSTLDPKDLTALVKQIQNNRTCRQQLMDQFHAGQFGSVSSSSHILASDEQMKLDCAVCASPSDAAFFRTKSGHDSYVKNINDSIVFCLTCGDCLCEQHFLQFHDKGNRRSHNACQILPCGCCQDFIARLQCLHCFAYFCKDCFVSRHSKELPRDLDIRPRQILYGNDIHKADNESSVSVKDLLKSNKIIQELEIRNRFNKEMPLEGITGLQEMVPNHSSIDNYFEESVDARSLQEVLNSWHPFVDASGNRYEFSFETGETIRGSVRNFFEMKQKKVVDLILINSR